MLMHMIIYEVNLIVESSIFAEYYPWLIDHIQEMFQFKGFLKAEVAEEKTMTTAKHALTVRYMITDAEALDDYLNQHAPTMRARAKERFGDKFTASRRVFTDFVEITPVIPA